MLFMSREYMWQFKQKQTGEALLESLIGMVMMALIGVGIVTATSKMSLSQHDMRLQEMAINQLRTLLMNNNNGTINICVTAPTITLPGLASALTVDRQGCNTTVTATVNGAPVTSVPVPLVLSVNHSELGGRVVVGGTWVN
jgi:hypothetical protein